MIDLDELERKREAAMKAGNTSVPWVRFITAMCDNAPALIAMARRMEWIEKNVLCIDTASDPDNLVRVWFADGSGGFKIASGRTLADAIDAAMQEKP